MTSEITVIQWDGNLARIREVLPSAERRPLRGTTALVIICRCGGILQLPQGAWVVAAGGTVWGYSRGWWDRFRCWGCQAGPGVNSRGILCAALVSGQTAGPARTGTQGPRARFRGGWRRCTAT